MRMWQVDPSLMCDLHITREHRDLHLTAKLIAEEKMREVEVSAMRNKISTRHLPSRHEALAAELISRNIGHSCPLPDITMPRLGEIDKSKSCQELMERCPHCRQRIEEHRQDVTKSFLTHQRQIENIAKAISRRYRFDEAELLSEAFVAFLEVHESRSYDPAQSSFSTWLQWKVRGRLLDLVRERAKKAARMQEQDLLLIPEPDSGPLDYDSLSWDAQRIIRLILESPRELLDRIVMRTERRNPRSYRAALRQFLLDAGWLSKEIDRCFAEIRELFS